MSTLFLLSFGLLELNYAKTAVTTAVTAAWNVAESICRIGVFSVGWLFPYDDMVLLHNVNHIR